MQRLVSEVRASLSGRRERAHAVFSCMDADEEGSLAVDTFLNTLADLLPESVEPRQLRKLAKRLDGYNDGRIRYNSFLEHYSTPAAPRSTSRGRSSRSPPSSDDDERLLVQSFAGRSSIFRKGGGGGASESVYWRADPGRATAPRPSAGAWRPRSPPTPAARPRPGSRGRGAAQLSRSEWR
jgi:hypothetical protein